MSYQSEEIVLNKAARCHDWPLALCGQGDGCHYDHHENLDPASIKKVEYQVSNELGEACERCLNSATECDKKTRYPRSDDPCSECRHFGGPGCSCVLNTAVSYNDVLWRLMINREKSGFDLPAAKDRQAPRGNGKIPGPMRDNEVMSGWEGSSKGELLSKGDMLPAEVRRHPRAYLVPPRATLSTRHAEARGYDQAAFRKSKSLQSRGAFQGSGGGQRGGSFQPRGSFQESHRGNQSHGINQPTPVAFLPQPQADPFMGRVVRATTHYDRSEVSYEYESGNVLFYPFKPTSWSAQAPPTQSRNNARPAFPSPFPMSAPAPISQSGPGVSMSQGLTMPSAPKRKRTSKHAAPSSAGEAQVGEQPEMSEAGSVDTSLADFHNLKANYKEDSDDSC
ncbi:hypothetical protein D6D24_03221 [Aureobasidium pullulans]|uniref:C3H1-type domain-containing protein n=1 Tax=Aureobasidium pullulans TaxID=5580 RepID=A0A4S9ZXM9_AURPU|nr:hypothetical protein D6D24_03221 [Aureobasidium pullulans]TIA09935.1 hypothetical protein D6C81_08514 [Aureobasidium pullulans]